MIDTILGYFGGKRIPVALVIIALFGYWWLMEWAEVKFIPRVQAEQSMSALSNKVDANNTSLSKKIDANNTLMRNHIAHIDIRENKKAIGVVRNQQYSLKQYVAANGKDAMTNQREEDLKNDMSDLIDVKDCYNRGEEDCE